MTTIILMQKLLTMKLDFAASDKMQLQQVNINKKKPKVLNSLKEILENQTSLKTCRLCLRAGGRKIFRRDKDFDVALNIRYILGIEITEEDGKPQHICSDCEHTVRQVIQLKQTAETTQWRLQQELDMVADAASDWSDEPEQHGGYFKAGDTGVARKWICGKCRTSFCTQEEFAEHEKLRSCRTKLRSYVCETCGMELKSLSRLKRHSFTHTDLLPYACASCPYRARTAHSLGVHARGHSGARPARCGLCGATFASTSNLASHRRRHLPPRYHCAACPRSFKCRAGLNNHMASQHSNGSKPHNCNICGKTFSTRKMLLRHELKAHNRPKMRLGALPSYMRLQEDK